MPGHDIGRVLDLRLGRKCLKLADNSLLRVGQAPRVPDKLQSICYDTGPKKIKALQSVERGETNWDSLLLDEVSGLCCLT